jgi:transcription antitermination factor NusA-like protein
MSKAVASLEERQKQQFSELLSERGGFPQKLGDKGKPLAQRIQALRWQLDRFAEMVMWDDDTARFVMNALLPFHKTMMTMRLETGQYDGKAGDLLYEFDVMIQQTIDPTEDVSR